MITAVLLSILANFSFSTNDISGAVGSRQLGGPRMSLYAWLCGCVVMGFLSLFMIAGGFSLKPLMVNAGLAVILAMAYPIFLHAVEKGNATINGVIAGCFPAWVVILSLIFFDETLTAVQAMAVVVIFVGLILSSLHLTKKTRLNNLFNRYSLMALAVSMLWGIYFTFIRYPIEQYGWFEASAVTQLFATAISLVVLVPIIRRGKPLKFKKEHLKMPTVNALTGAIGGLSYNYALTIASSSVVAPIAGSYPGLYAVGAYFIFKEKLNKMQVVGVVLLLIGVIGLSVASI